MIGKIEYKFITFLFEEDFLHMSTKMIILSKSQTIRLLFENNERISNREYYSLYNITQIRFIVILTYNEEVRISTLC